MCITSIERCPTMAPRQSTPPQATVSYVISVYFDGTKNNRENTRQRVNQTSLYNALDFVNFDMDMISFENDLSNVAKLEEKATTSPPYEVSIYVEGIGTINLAADDMIGSAFGTGVRGISAKVAKGLREVHRHVVRTHASRRVEKVTLNAFGFSRGAAAARNFIDQAYVNHSTRLQTTLERAGVQLDAIEINFIGLFDTVASHGGTDFSDDTVDLHLRAIRYANKVVQLAAAEEYRAKFPLTGIESAGSNGIEIFLPGVHSDIGGGYRDNTNEEDMQLLDIDGTNSSETSLRLNADKLWLTRRGWYTDGEIELSVRFGELKVTRRNISNKYSRIPLKIMGDFAEANGVTFNAVALSRVCNVPPNLTHIRNLLESHAAVPAGRQSLPQDWWGNEQHLKDLRHQHLHFSAMYGTLGMAPNWDPNVMLGERKRLNYSG